MIIIGCDFHTRFQQIAMLETETGEIVERRVEHEGGEAQAFYAALPAPARVGMEATGYARWFERMLREQGHELWIGDARAIRAKPVLEAESGSVGSANRETRWCGFCWEKRPGRSRGRTRNCGGVFSARGSAAGRQQR